MSHRDGTIEERAMTSTHIRWGLITAAAVALATCGLGLQYHVRAKLERSSAYSIHPDRFLGQRHRLNVGMDRADVQSMITEFDAHETKSSEDIYRLNSTGPQRPNTLDLRIYVWHDAEGKVSKFSYADG
jgi:hypothetical protein